MLHLFVDDLADTCLPLIGRFQSGFFFSSQLLDSFDYYWRVEPSIKFFCDLNYDPFQFMIDNKKSYGWTISIYE